MVARVKWWEWRKQGMGAGTSPGGGLHYNRQSRVPATGGLLSKTKLVDFFSWFALQAVPTLQALSGILVRSLVITFLSSGRGGQNNAFMEWWQSRLVGDQGRVVEVGQARHGSDHKPKRQPPLQPPIQGTSNQRTRRQDNDVGS